MELMRCMRLNLQLRLFPTSTKVPSELQSPRQLPSLRFAVQKLHTLVLAQADTASSQAELNESSRYVDGNLDANLELQTMHNAGSSQRRSELIFLGTGTSEGIPRVSCLTHPSKKCSVCWEATRFGNKNRRRNTSIAIRLGTSGSSWKTILIDAGKYFYHSALQWFPYYGIRELDAVLLTHSHADACGGLDDLRDWTNNVQDSVQVFATHRDLQVLAKTHYYLLDTSVITAGTAVSKLHFSPISEEPFFVHGVKVTPLPVWHGADYRSLGFRIGDVCYISDVSEIPEETYPLLKSCGILILDALRPDRSTATHFSLPRALEEVRKIKPKRALFTGMMHLMDHDIINEQLAQLRNSEGLDAQLSYDGLRIPVNLD